MPDIVAELKKQNEKLNQENDGLKSIVCALQKQIAEQNEYIIKLEERQETMEAKDLLIMAFKNRLKNKPLNKDPHASVLLNNIDKLYSKLL